MAPGLVRGISIGLQKSLADRSRDHGVLALGDMRQSVAHPMHPTALPAGAEHARDGMAQPAMGVRDHQLDALEAALDQSLQKARPERLRLRGADAKTDDLAPAFGGDGDGDYCSDRDDAAAVAHIKVGGVEPQIWPLAIERAVEEGSDPLIDVFAQLGDLAL